VSVSDAAKRLRDFLAANAGLTALVGTRIYAERTEPPEGYKPGQGSCVCFSISGSVDYSDAFQNCRVQFKCYGKDEVEANQVYRALYDALNRQSGQYVRWAINQTLGQTLREPDTKWVFVLTYFSVWIL
jgi:hypothetical protein